MAAGHLPPGKLPVHLLAELLGELEPAPPEVRLGPAVGEDACVLTVERGALVAATDPITFTGVDIGRLAVVVNANDVAVMGVRPRWFLAAILLPRGTTEDDVRTLFAGMRGALAELGIALVGGHTEVTPVVSQPLVVGQMLGLAENDRFVATGGARPGDIVVQVGLAPIEGAAVLAVEAAERLGGCDPATVQAAADAIRIPGLSVVEPALAATGLGATALHDPTEGGLASGLHELATAARVGLRVDPAQVRWFEPGLAVCRALGADPWATLASGSLLATFPTDRATAATEAIAARGYPVAILGVAEPGDGVHDTEGRAISWPARDEVARLLS
jgi:hydrogenase expression/formation protein HypE